MWTTSIAALVLVTAAAAALSENLSSAQNVHSGEFAIYMQKYGKSYCEPGETNSNSQYAVCDESRRREKIYYENKYFIEDYNRQHDTHQLKINGFADLTSEEFASTHLGYIPGDTPLKSDRIKELIQEDPLPSSIDWREHGLVTPVKNQGKCGACWAFSTCASIEGAFAKAKDQLISLSEQELVDCDKTAKGCTGGNFDQAFQWVIENRGIDSELHYPYTANDSLPCPRPKLSQVEARINEYFQVTPMNESQLQIAAAGQPVSVALEGSQKPFQFYGSGVFDGKCGTELDHAVAIIGYGEDKDKPYWILKNSWGYDWGEDGYMRIARGINQCGLATSPYYAYTKP